MPKKKILSGNAYNYKEQLETIISTKVFSADVKNLLSSLIYKLENSYKDYEIVKGSSEELGTIIEEIISFVSECDQIEIISPNSRVIKRFDRNNITYEVDQRNKKIKTIQSEKSLLYALYSMPHEKKFFISEKYDVIRETLPYVLNKGKRLSKFEIIRDFDGWSWNNMISELESIESNLVYQNLIMLFGSEFIENWMSNNEENDAIAILEQNLDTIFENEQVNDFFKELFEISIIITCNENDDIKRKFREELRNTKEELKRIRVKKQLDEEIATNIEEYNTEIENLNKILNNKNKFNAELKKSEIIDRNDKIQIMTPEALKKNLEKRIRINRKKIKIESELLDKEKYKKYKEKLEKKKLTLSIIEQKEVYFEKIINFQKLILSGMKNIIMNTNDKDKLLDFVYLIRYYNFIPFSEEEYIKDVKELKQDINEIEDILIEKLRENKMIAKLSNNSKFDDKIIKKVFKMRVIDLDGIAIEFKSEDRIKIILYDEETIEKGFAVNKSPDVKIAKFNKKIWLFT